MKTEDIIEKCWLRTFTGKVIDPENIKVSDIDLIDIGHALANTCRYGGHCNTYYSVAEHSLLVYELIKENYPNGWWLQLEGLLHDATEAYIADIPTPFKRLLPEYKKLETKIAKVIEKKFYKHEIRNDYIKVYDREALCIEMPCLFDGETNYKIKRYTPEIAFALFISTANKLIQEIKYQESLMQ